MTGIIIIILIGLFLFLVEFLLIPGITVAGIAGVVFLIGGIVWAYIDLGTTAGHITLVCTVAATALTIGMALRSKTWTRFMLATNIDSQVENPASSDLIKPGDTGITISRLTPMGKVKVHNMVVEAKSTGSYIDQKTEVTIIRVDGPSIIVKPKNT